MSLLYGIVKKSRIFQTFQSHKYFYINYSIIKISSRLSSVALCPESKDVEDTWSAKCHVDRDTWNNAKPFSEMPGLKNIPIIGNSWRFLPGGEYYNMHSSEFLEKFHKKFGKIGKVEGLIGVKKGAVLLDRPEDVELVYKQESATPIRDLFPCMEYFRSNYRQDIFKNAKGLISSNGQEWLSFRQKVNKVMMQPIIVKQYVSPIDAIAKDFVQSIKKIRKPDDSVGDIFIDESKKWILESIAFPALDRRLGCFDDNLPIDSMPNKLFTNLKQSTRIIEELDHRPNLWKYMSTPKFRRAIKIFNHQISLATYEVNKSMEIINAKKSMGQIENEGEKSVLEKLMEIDPNVAFVMILEMLFGAIDTTSNVLINILYNLSVNKVVQQRLRDEINSVIPRDVYNINVDHLSKMLYLKACIKEALRIYPPTPGTLRILTKDTVLSGYQVPKGITVSLYHMRYSLKEEHFPRPTEFIPERWLRVNQDTELSYKNAHPFATMPFGFGPRSCVGRRFADLKLEVVITNFIRNFDISWKGDPPRKTLSNFNCFEGPSCFVFQDIKNDFYRF